MPEPDEDQSESLQPVGPAQAQADVPFPAELLDSLPPYFQDVFRQVAQDPQAAIKIVAAAYSASFYRGPLPPASEMREYEAVLPGSADRILTMAEEQARHRQGLEKTAIDGNARRSWWGLWLGAAISLAAIGGAVALGATGHTAASIGLGGIDLAALAGVFVVGRREQRRERVQKDAVTHVPTPPFPAPGPPAPNSN
jgi:uncharacterized membrane protein